MKNIHLLPTDKPSRLFKFANQLHLDTIPKEYYKKYNIYITDSEEIKEGDWYLDTFNTQRIKANEFSDHKHYGNSCKKIILTTDPNLIADGVQSIDDEFLEWFVKNPSCEQIEVQKWFDGLDFLEYKLITPKEEAEQETLEEAAEKYLQECRLLTNIHLSNPIHAERCKNNFIAGAKYMAERMYSEEEVKRILMKTGNYTKISLDAWFEQFKKK